MSEQAPIDKMRAIMARLRDPETGCAWDLKQTHRSLIPYVIEEAYEVAEAIEENDIQHLKEELGDLLLQVLFHSQLANEAGHFNFDDVCDALAEKMVRRHPHVFAGKEFSSEAERKLAWEEAKRQEREQRKPIGSEAFPSKLEDISHAQPALMAADQIQSRAARYGFDWKEVEPVYEKLVEETDEIRDAVEKGDPEHILEEVGDLLFVGVNLARHLGVDAETALRAANRKFARRFQCMEQELAAQQKEMMETSLHELDALWDRAKLKLKEENS